MIVCDQDTAVVVLSYNGKDWHEKFLPLILQEASTGYDVVVVNNASTDDTASYVQEKFPSAKLLNIEVNKGFASGYSDALKNIQAKYFVLLSADFEVTTGWFPPLLNAMQRVEGLAACQPKIRYWRDREYFEYAGAAGGFMDYLGYLFCRGRIFFDLEKDQHQYDDDVEVFWASGGCLMVKRDLYEKVGGLDPDFFAHMEEVDLCWRLKNAGYKIGYIGQSVVYHVGGSVISYGSAQKLYFNFRNNLILLLKNEKWAKLIWLLPFRFSLDVLAGFRLLFTGHPKEMFTIMKAHANFLRGLGQVLEKRKAVQKLITARNEVGIYKRSIIWQYFGLRKKTFSKLKWATKRLQ